MLPKTPDKFFRVNMSFLSARPRKRQSPRNSVVDTYRTTQTVLSFFLQPHFLTKDQSYF